MWAFTEPPNYGVSTNPTQGEHFVNDRVDRNDTLVREPGQNTYDAKRPDVSSVELRFTLMRGGDAPNAAILAPYLDPLIPHLNASGLDLESVDFARPSLLLVEDFGTLGLQGATDNDDGESLSLFWRNIGESHKEGSRGGRWGLGKTVFANSSRISTWFGMTVRENDGRQLLIGQVALRKHKIGSKTYQPHALYCASEPGQFELPIEDTEKIISFRSAFRLSRQAEPGLSIAIPFPHESITEKNLLKAAIQHFFVPILRGRMVITINGKELNSATLRTIASEIDSADLREMDAAIRVAEEICTLPPASIREVDNPATMNFPAGVLGSDAFNADTLASIKQAYQRGDLVSVKLPLTIRPKHGDARPSHIKLFLKHIPHLAKGHDFYLRDGISVIEHRSFAEAEKAIGLLLADHEVVSRFLGDAENPAHTAWNAKARGLESKYRDPQKSVMFIRRALRQLFDVVAKEEGVEDPNALLDVFFVQREDGTPGPGPRPPGPLPPPPEPPPPPPPPPPPSRPKLNVSQIDGGFLIKAGSGLTMGDLPLGITVKAAYEIRRGNPFNKYHRSDFEFEKEPIEIRTDTAKVSAIAGTGNILSFQADAPDFEVEVIGFDANRDLKLATSISSEELADDTTI